MAYRIVDYANFRKIHLYTSFTILVFLIMYFVTGFVLTHYDWFEHPDPLVTKVNAEVSIAADMDLTAISRFVQDEFNLKGQRKEPRINHENEVILEFIRPGYHHNVALSPDRKNITITTREENMYQTMVVFHRLEKYGGGWVYDLYIFMMDLTSIALVLFAITGLVLWLKLVKQKLVGVILLLASLLYTSSVVWSLWNG